MIVNCPSCSKRYKFDEDKLKGRSAKITCPSCKHVFVVRPPDTEEPSGVSAAEGADIYTLDFRKFGVTWKVRKGLGLTYDFHSLQQLQEMLTQGQVDPQDSISYDQRSWRTIDSIPDIESWFGEAAEKAERGEIPKPSYGYEADEEDEDMADAPTTLVRPGSNLADEIRRSIEKSRTPAPVARSEQPLGEREARPGREEGAPTTPLTGGGSPAGGAPGPATGPDAFSSLARKKEEAERSGTSMIGLALIALVLILVAGVVAGYQLDWFGLAAPETLPSEEIVPPGAVPTDEGADPEIGLGQGGVGEEAPLEEEEVTEPAAPVVEPEPAPRPRARPRPAPAPAPAPAAAPAPAPEPLPPPASGRADEDFDVPPPTDEPVPRQPVPAVEPAPVAPPSEAEPPAPASGWIPLTPTGEDAGAATTPADEPEPDDAEPATP